jgi:hypothetical protein
MTLPKNRDERITALTQSSRYDRVRLLQQWPEITAIQALTDVEIHIRNSILKSLKKRSRDRVLDRIKQYQITNEEADQESEEKRKNDLSNKKAGLDLLPTEIFWEIASILPLKDVKTLRLLNSATHHLAEAIIGRYYRTATVDVGTNAAQHLRRFFETELSRNTETLIIREHPRFTDWREAPYALRYIRDVLDSLGREINVGFRSCKRGSLWMFLDEFDGYKWTITLENVYATHLDREDSRLRAVQALELVLPQSFNGYSQGSVIEAREGLFSFASEVTPSKKLSVALERTLSPDEETILERLRGMGLQIRKTYIEPKHDALSRFQAEFRTSLSQYLQRYGISNEIELEQCYIDIDDSSWLSRDGFTYSWA